MTVTFLVAINVDDAALGELTNIALDIQDKLEGEFQVESVHPWARPNNPVVQPAGGFTSLLQPPQPPV